MTGMTEVDGICDNQEGLACEYTSQPTASKTSRPNLLSGPHVPAKGVCVYHGGVCVVVESVRALCCSNLADNARSSLLAECDQIDYSGKIKLSTWGSEVVVKAIGGIGTIIESEQVFEIAQMFMAPATIVNSSIGQIITNYTKSTRSPSAVIHKSHEVKIPAPFAASFSPRGPNTGSQHILKRDVAAPGINILASYTTMKSITGQKGDTQFSEFTLMSGTSRSCPHVAGVVAYVKSFHPDWNPAAIRSAIITTVKVQENSSKLDSSIWSNDLKSGFFHADPHPGNILICKGPEASHQLYWFCNISLTVISSLVWRMELDIQMFLNNADQQHFEFQHFPSSYLQLVAHRVAQHYNMQKMVQDNALDGQGSKILVWKLPETKPNRNSLNDANGVGTKGNPVRSVEERKEEYDRARACIFSSPRSSESGDTSSMVPMDGRNSSTSKDENETSKNPMADSKRYISVRDSCSTRVAIVRDREKDHSDPDYDRSYGRGIPASTVNLVPFNLQKAQPLFAQYDATFNQLRQM
ncbi:Subtilisin-like protease SBT4.14 [Glycine soja]